MRYIICAVFQLLLLGASYSQAATKEGKDDIDHIWFTLYAKGQPKQLFARNGNGDDVEVHNGTPFNVKSGSPFVGTIGFTYKNPRHSWNNFFYLVFYANPKATCHKEWYRFDNHTPSHYTPPDGHFTINSGQRLSVALLTAHFRADSYKRWFFRQRGRKIRLCYYDGNEGYKSIEIHLTPINYLGVIKIDISEEHAFTLRRGSKLDSYYEPLVRIYAPYY